LTAEAIGQNRLLEICLEDVGGTAVAVAAGADRVEVCSRLDVGGLTPSDELVEGALSVAASDRIGVQVLIRCRAGDFSHSRDEIDVMCAEIRGIQGRAESHRVLDRLGFVVGTLTSARLVDVEALAAYAAAAAGVPITVPKAFDEIVDQSAALDTLIAAGVERVLTSGGAPTAAAGADGIRSLVAQSNGRIAILAGGGVRPDNVSALLAHTGVHEVHLRAQDAVGRTDAAVVRTMRSLLDG